MSNSLDKNDFEPDTEFGVFFYWEDVIDYFDKILPSENFKGRDKCPKCERNPEELFWIEFKSPAWTWSHKCGSLGPLSICLKCRIQVEFIVKRVN